MKKKVIIIGLSVLAVGAVTIIVVRSIQKSGIIKRLDEAFKHPDSQDASGGLNKLLASGVFNTTTYQKSGKATITLMEARDRSKTIYDAYSYLFSSDQMTIVNAFNGLGHQHDVSKIAHEYKASYHEDLLEVLKYTLTDNAKMNMLVDKINKLPKN
ncbi:hypothetical protein D3C87_32010 [compost metagenome]